VNGVTLRILLPDGQTSAVGKGSGCEVSGQVLTYHLGNMAQDQRLSTTYKAYISPDVKDKEAQETLYVATGEDSAGSFVQNSQRYTVVTDTDKKVERNTAAAALTGGGSRSNGIFPSYFLDWLVIIIMLALCVVAYFFWKNYSNKNEKEDEEEIGSLLGEIPPLAPALAFAIPQKPVEQKPEMTPWHRTGALPTRRNQAEFEAINSEYNAKAGAPDNLPI
jgi:hypothetical protein